MNNNTLELYNEYEKNDHGLFKDKEISQSFIQNVVSESTNFKSGSRKYVIQLKTPKSNELKIKSNESKSKAKSSESKSKKEEIVEKKIDQMNKTFESMMVQFQHMVQLNQLIQMNQMNQMQIMNQLVELKSNVVETRQDLSYKLKEINSQIDSIKSVQTEQSSKINEINNKRTTTVGRKPKEVINDEKEDNVDYSHLAPLYKENVYTLLQSRDINIRLVRNILTSKNVSGFIKIFDMLYKSKNLNNEDIYPIRVIKAKTLQYYNEEHNWLIDTNGTNIMNIICANLSLLLSKVNNDFFGTGEFDLALFVDNEKFIQDLGDKRIRNQLFSSIKDSILNHSLNFKANSIKKEYTNKENLSTEVKVSESKSQENNIKKDKEETNIKNIQINIKKNDEEEEEYSSESDVYESDEEDD